MNRREFAKTTALGFGVGLTPLSDAASVFGTAANERGNLGVIGYGGRGGLDKYGVSFLFRRSMSVPSATF